jgi:hypothetical protein
MRTTHSIRSFLLVSLLAGAAAGCGPYRIRYQMPSARPSEEKLSVPHAHGLGLLGGGGWFFIVHQLFPALIDYTGPVDLRKQAPGGFREVSHYHTFGQNAGAAFISWLIFVNAYHESTVEIVKAGPNEPRQRPVAKPKTTRPRRAVASRER